jgi:Zn-dependent protease with chaperone function
LAGAIDLAAEVLAHGVIAANVVQLLIRRVPVLAPASRLAYRVSALTLPLVLPPLLHLAAPFRRDEWFADVSLFATVHWQRLTLAGLPARDLGLVVLAAAGALLLLPDVARIVRAGARGWRTERRRLPAGDPLVATLHAEVADVAATLAVAPPAVVVCDTAAVRLHCHGPYRPVIVASRGAVERLPREQLRAAIAHELAHVWRRDIVRGWLLMGLRLVQWFNPVAQIVGRRAVQEMELEADRLAAAATGQPLAIARALVSSVRERDTDYLGLLGRSRISAFEERCRRLLEIDARPDAFPPRSWAELAAANLGVAALLFFVV